MGERDKVSEHDIGIGDSGAENEFPIKRETAKAYLLIGEDGKEFWMPKSAFNEEGLLFEWAEDMFLTNSEE